LSGVAVTAADGLSGLAEDSNQEHNHTFWSFDAQSQAQQGSWASGKTLIGDEDINYLAQPEPLGRDDAMLPPPVRHLRRRHGHPHPGDATGANKQGAKNVVEKVKDTLTGD